MLLQMAVFHSFLWLSSIPQIYVPHHLYPASTKGTFTGGFPALFQTTSGSALTKREGIIPEAVSSNWVRASHPEDTTGGASTSCFE